MSKKSILNVVGKKKAQRKKMGLPPGSVVFVGEQKVDEVRIHYLHFDEQHFNEKEFGSNEVKTYHESDESVMQWYDIRGLHDTELIEKLGILYKIHPLVLEDIASTTQRPKFEEYGDSVFIKYKSLSFNRGSCLIESEEIGLYFGNGFLLSFQEREDDLFIKVRERIRNDKGRIRKRGADYLAYALIDVIVDHYFKVVDEIHEEIEILEEQINLDPQQGAKTKILSLKKQVLMIRKGIVPLREALSQFSKSSNPLINDSTQVFVRDAYDHSVQLTDMIDSSRDLLSGLQDLFITEISFRMNKVMQTLTIVTVIFVPITFLAGIYGMNFTHMPELNSKNGYYNLLIIMGVIVIALLMMFKKKKWI